MKSIICAMAVLLGAAVISGPAQAAYVINLRQVGPDLIAIGEGSLDLTALTFVGTGHPLAFLENDTATITLGDGGNQHPAEDVYGGVSGPTSFGGGGAFGVSSDSSSGMSVSILGTLGKLGVQPGYVSETPLGTSIAVYDNHTLASLHLTPGTYVWSWGQLANYDTLTLSIAVPKPATWAMLILGVFSIGAMLRSRKRPQSTAIAG